MNNAMTDPAKSAIHRGQATQDYVEDGLSGPFGEGINFTPMRIFNARPAALRDVFEQVIPPFMLNPNGHANLVSWAMILIEQFAMLANALKLLSRHDQRNKLKEEYNARMEGIEIKLEYDEKAAKIQLKMGVIDLKTGKTMIHLAEVQFILQVTAAAVKASSEVAKAFGPLGQAVGAVPGATAAVLEASAQLIGHTISVVQLIGQGQNSMLQALVIRYNAEGDAYQKFHDAEADFIRGERELEQDFGSTMTSIFEKALSMLEALAPMQYLHLQG